MNAGIRQFFAGLILLPALALGQAEFTPKSIPRVTAVPLARQQVSFQVSGKEVTRFHYDPDDRRTFLFPVNGPSNLSLTRMGHPHDPVGHSHHNSLWISHHDVNGMSFWGDRNAGQIRLLRLEKLQDSDEAAAATVFHAWIGTNDVPVLYERRQMLVHPVERGEWLLIIDMRFDIAKKEVTFGKTPFGLVGVRMAKSIGVHDGGGRIRNSEGGLNEAGVHWKRARWVDYSGAISENSVEGITLFDHPANPNHPTTFHVRDDGWMGASLTYDGPRTISATNGLQLRYGFYIHTGMPEPKALDAQWRKFVSFPVTNLARAKM